MQALDELKGVDSVSEVPLEIMQPLVEPLIEVRVEARIEPQILLREGAAKRTGLEEVWSF